MLQTDDITKQLKRRFLNARSQARYRGQVWQIDFENYCQLFLQDSKHLQTGRNSDSYNLCRIDQNGIWSLDNVVIRTRGEHASNLMLEKNRAIRR